MTTANYHRNMSGQTGRNLAPPGGLRPAQLGIVLVRRVLLGHIGATLVDLACRGCLSLEPLDEDGLDWRLTIVQEEPEGLLGYEQALLHGLLGGHTTLRMAHITPVLAPRLEVVRAGIVRDALDAGRLRAGIGRRFAVTRAQRRRQDQNPGRRTRLGEELLRGIKDFKRDLRALAAAGDTATLAPFASYAMIFGLAAPLPVRDPVPGQPSGDAVPPRQTPVFAARWQEALGSGGSGFFGWVWDPYVGQSPDYASLHNHHGYPHSGGHHGGSGGHHGGFGGHDGGFGGGHGGGGGHG